MDIRITPEAYVEYLKRVAEKIASEKDYITELDAATGDGDHWANMHTGFQKLTAEGEAMKGLAFDALFKKAAMTIMSGVGGSSGILYASAYLKASQAAAGRDCLDAAGLLAVLQAELEGIMQRGKAQPGFKTMIDPLHAAAAAMQEAMPRGPEAAIAAMRAGAKAGMEATKDMEAVMGRAVYQANKGVGHLDPGAVTMYYQLDLLGEAALETLA